MEYRIMCRYYGDEGDKPIEIMKTNLPDKPRPGELLWLETDDHLRVFVVFETVREFYKLNANDGEMIANDVFVCEIKVCADELKTENGEEK